MSSASVTVLPPYRYPTTDYPAVVMTATTHDGVTVTRSVMLQHYTEAREGVTSWHHGMAGSVDVVADNSTLNLAEIHDTWNQLEQLALMADRARLAATASLDQRAANDGWPDIEPGGRVDAPE